MHCLRYYVWREQKPPCCPQHSSQAPPFPAKSNPRVVPLEPPEPTGVHPPSSVESTVCTTKPSAAQLEGNLGSSFSESLLGPGKGRLGSSCRSRSLRITNTGSRNIQPQVLHRFFYHLQLLSLPSVHNPHSPVEPPTSQDSRKRLLGFVIWTLPMAHTALISSSNTAAGQPGWKHGPMTLVLTLAGCVSLAMWLDLSEPFSFKPGKAHHLTVWPWGSGALIHAFEAYACSLLAYSGCSVNLNLLPKNY